MSEGELPETNQLTSTTPQKKLPYVFAIAVSIGVLSTIIVAGVLLYTTKKSPDHDDRVVNDDQKPASKETWQNGDYVIKGPYADSEIMDLGNGTYRMYYGVEPEVQNDRLSVYSATSTDGVTWTQEPGKRASGGERFLAGDIIKLQDGTWRMYYGMPGGGIKSALSSDGLNWTDDPGIRIGAASTTIPEAVRIGFPTAYQQRDGSFVLVYRGNIEKVYDAYGKVPNNATEVLFWASSQDGLTFTEQGVAIETRNANLKGLADGPEFAVWNDGSVRLYFWGYRGVYYSTFTNGTFSEPEFVFSGFADANMQFQPNPPSDPSLIKVGNTWFMYYGQHQKGIVSATLKE